MRAALLSMVVMQSPLRTHHSTQHSVLLQLQSTWRGLTLINPTDRFATRSCCILLSSSTVLLESWFSQNSIKHDVLQDCRADHDIPETGTASAAEVLNTPSAVPHSQLAAPVPQHVAPVGVRQDVTAQAPSTPMQHPTREVWKDRKMCIRELTRASEESTLLRQSLEHMTKACDSYQQQLQEILDQRNLLYRDYASAVLQMKAKYATLEQTNTHLRQMNDDFREKLCSLEAAKREDVPRDKHTSTAAEVVVLRHKLQRV